MQTKLELTRASITITLDVDDVVRFLDDLEAHTNKDNHYFANAYTEDESPLLYELTSELKHFLLKQYQASKVLRYYADNTFDFFKDREDV